MKQKRYRTYGWWAIGLSLILALLGLGWNMYVKYTTPVTKYALEIGDFELQIPKLGVTSTTISLVWNPVNDERLVGYDIYVNQEKVKEIRPSAKGASIIPRIELKGLESDTVYLVQVKAVDDRGATLSDSSKVPVKTLPKEPRLEATAYGAVGDGITDNTLALQKAIRDTPAGGILHLSKGVYRTGTLFLHSYMTLELDEDAVLMAINDSSAFVKPNYVVTGGTPYLGLLQLEGDEQGPIENIVIRGGTIDGYGWKEDLLQEENASEADAVPQDVLDHTGLLSKSEVQAAMRRGASYEKGNTTRSSLVVIHHGKDILMKHTVLRNASAHMVEATQVDQLSIQDVRMEGMYSGDGLHWDGVGLLTQNLVMERMQQGIVVLAGHPIGSSVTEQWNAYNLQIRHSRVGIVFANTGNTWIQHMYLQGLTMEDVLLAMRVHETTTIGGGIRDIVVREAQLRGIAQQIDIGNKRNSPVEWIRSSVTFQRQQKTEES